MPDPYKPHVDALTHAISAERLNGYRRPGDADELDALTRYAWNMAIAEAFYPTLQCLEVALRNTLHTAIAAHFGNAGWLTMPPPVLAPREATAVAEAVQVLTRQQQQRTAGRLVAELGFGFWTSLLDRRYEPALWPALLRPAFPQLPRRRRTRRERSRRFTAIRRLRNRVFHHEPIWQWQDLLQQHRDLHEALAWISLPLARTVAALDRFPTVYAAGSTPLRALLEPVARTP